MRSCHAPGRRSSHPTPGELTSVTRGNAASSMNLLHDSEKSGGAKYPPQHNTVQMHRCRRCQRYRKPLRMGPRKRQGAGNNVAGLCKPTNLLQARRSSSSKRRTKKAEPLQNAISFLKFETCLLFHQVEDPVTPCRGSSREAILPASRAADVQYSR